MCQAISSERVNTKEDSMKEVMHIEGSSLTGGYGGMDIYRYHIQGYWFAVKDGRLSLGYYDQEELFTAIKDNTIQWLKEEA